MRKLQILIFISFACLTGFAQTGFTGKIKFHITYLDVPESLEGYESMLPDSSFIYLKASKLRTEVPLATGESQIVIFDKESYNGYLLMNMYGTKTAVEMTREYMKSSKDSTITQNITYFDDKKKVAGYMCKKAIFTVTSTDGTKQETELWYTEDIPNITQNFEGLKGFALTYTSSQNGIISRATATSVMYQKLDEALFEVPEDYERRSMQELMETGGN